MPADENEKKMAELENKLAEPKSGGKLADQNAALIAENEQLRRKLGARANTTSNADF